MDRKEFRDFLKRAVKVHFLTESEAKTLLTKFDDGEISDSELPILLKDGIKEVKSDKDLEKSLLLLLAFLQKKEYEVKTIDDVFALPYDDRENIREQLQDYFILQGQAYALKLQDNDNVNEWQASFTQAAVDNILQQSVVGFGRFPTKKEIGVLSSIVVIQTTFSSKFADEIATRQLLDNKFSSDAIAARSARYAGQGRAEWYKGSEADIDEEYEIHYIALADACVPCRVAAAESPYAPVEGPFPGEVCLGGGFCRCRRVRKLVENA